FLTIFTHIKTPQTLDLSSNFWGAPPFRAFSFLSRTGLIFPRMIRCFSRILIFIARPRSISRIFHPWGKDGDWIG
ncbi:hypothetical protein, partial [Alkalicoccobacillus porphyridii]|uniref:hypothetical protein n=1 Tax=Alkalicoccobacillus porphyridii TaxID=2597270 RepID=UPI001C8F339B